MREPKDQSAIQCSIFNIQLRPNPLVFQVLPELYDIGVLMFRLLYKVHGVYASLMIRAVKYIGNTNLQLTNARTLSSIRNIGLQGM